MATSAELTHEAIHEKVAPKSPTDAEMSLWYYTAFFLARSAATPLGLWPSLSAGTLAPERGRELAVALIAEGEERFRSWTHTLLMAKDEAPSWYRTMTIEVAGLHLASGLALAGSLTPAAPVVDSIRDAIGNQLDYLAGFREAVATGAYPIGADSDYRATLYAAAAWATGQQAGRIVNRLGGKTRERRILGMTHHCDDCLGQAAKGWRAIGSLRAIGDSRCKVHCDCHFIFR